MMLKQTHFIFYGSLNDFLGKQSSTIAYSYSGTPTVKDAIEAIGVPHPEVGGIFINEAPVDFMYKIKPGDSVEVFPIDNDSRQTVNLSDNLLIHFILDVHLGKLARDLRMLGFSSLYKSSYSKKDLVVKAEQESRILLSRDVNLLKNSKIKRGYWIRSQNPEEQLLEVTAYFKLINKVKPFTRCIVCNGKIDEVPKKAVEERLPAKTKHYFSTFYQCTNCSRIYWKGSHYERMLGTVKKLKEQLNN